MWHEICMISDEYRMWGVNVICDRMNPATRKIMPFIIFNEDSGIEGEEVSWSKIPHQENKFFNVHLL